MSKRIKEWKGLREFEEERKTIIIPYLQREYRWEKPQVFEFLNDLKSIHDDYAESNKDYMPTLGIFYLKSRDSENKVYQIIDGQQRLTTLLILLLYMNKEHKIKIKADSKEYDDNLNDIFVHKNFKNKSKLVEGYRLISKWMEEEKYDSKMKNELFNFIENDLYFYEFICHSDKDAVDTFIRLNSRGMVLSFVDLLKSHLFQSRMDLNIEEDLIKKYIDDTLSLIKCSNGKINYKLIEGAYKYIIKSYISFDVKKNHKLQYKQIVKYIDNNKKTIKLYFFDEWVEYIKIYALLDNKKSKVLYKDSKEYHNFKQIYNAIKCINKDEYLPILLRAYLEYDVKRNISLKEYNLVISNLLRKFLEIEIEEFRKFLDGDKNKFNSDVLEYKNIFQFVHVNNKFNLAKISSKDFEESFKLKNKNQLLHNFEKLWEEHDLKESYKKRYESIKELFKYIK